MKSYISYKIVNLDTCQFFADVYFCNKFGYLGQTVPNSVTLTALVDWHNIIKNLWVYDYLWLVMTTTIIGLS